MSQSKCFWLKIILLSICFVLSGYLFIISLGVDYQYQLAQEHIRFREEMPTLNEWINSPFGKLKSYLFNVTNAEAFLNGTDTKIKFQQIGPIVYQMMGYNEILERNDTTLTYKKHRYRHIQFVPEDSVRPDILNQTIVLPNMVLLGAAVKFHDWIPFVRHAFNAITINEKVFLKGSVYSFLWQFTTPGLHMLSSYVPNIVSNCGVLHNALREKEELYSVKIGTRNGIDNFFRIKTLNNKTVFKEQTTRQRYVSRHDAAHVKCPIVVKDALDNSLFPPFIKPETKLNIVANEICRTLSLQYQGVARQYGVNAYRYTIAEKSEIPSCLDTTYGIKLHKGMFDISACIINEAPAAFSSPHFYASSYNWSQHFEGFNPNAEEHEPHILLEPITGIPIIEKYRFQSNIPMPNMKGFNRDLEKFDHMVIPTFWYEFDMGELPWLVIFLIRFNVCVIPVLQPILMVFFVAFSLFCALKIYLLFKNVTFKSFLLKTFNCFSTKLETNFPETVKPATSVTDLDIPMK